MNFITQYEFLNYVNPFVKKKEQSFQNQLNLKLQKKNYMSTSNGRLSYVTTPMSLPLNLATIFFLISY